MSNYEGGGGGNVSFGVTKYQINGCNKRGRHVGGWTYLIVRTGRPLLVVQKTPPNSSFPPACKMQTRRKHQPHSIPSPQPPLTFFSRSTLPHSHRTTSSPFFPTRGGGPLDETRDTPPPPALKPSPPPLFVSDFEALPPAPPTDFFPFLPPVLGVLTTSSPSALTLPAPLALLLLLLLLLLFLFPLPDGVSGGPPSWNDEDLWSPFDALAFPLEGVGEEEEEEPLLLPLVGVFEAVIKRNRRERRREKEGEYQRVEFLVRDGWPETKKARFFTAGVLSENPPYFP